MVRPICNPNTGFTCQLLMLGKRLGLSGVNSQAGALPERTSLFRVAPHHPKEPFLQLVPVELPSSWPHLDPRFGWVIQHVGQIFLWLGSQVADVEATQATTLEHM